MSVQLIVVNYRTPHDLLGFVRAYQRYTPTVEHTLTIVNVDPLPADESIIVNLLADHDYIVNYENCGYGKAVNDAARTGDSAVIAIFNADTRLTDGVIDECYEAMMAEPSWGVLGPRQVDQDNRITHAGILGTNEKPFLRGWRKTNSDEYGDVREAVSVSGSAYFIKRAVWEELTDCELYQSAHPVGGAFLESPLYYEDMLCSVHARAHGYRVIAYGPAQMQHRWHQSVKHNKAEARAAQNYKVARQMYRYVCDVHQIPHE